LKEETKPPLMLSGRKAWAEYLKALPDGELIRNYKTQDALKILSDPLNLIYENWESKGGEGVGGIDMYRNSQILCISEKHV